jgi:hypothetical protein
MPCGKSAAITAISARTLAATSSAFAPGACTTCSALEQGAQPVALRAEFDARHVAETHDAPVLPGADHDGGVVLRPGEPTAQVDRDLRRHARARLPADRAGGQLQVPRPHTAQHLGCRQAARGHALGVEPDAHGVVARAPDVDLADAGQPLQPVAQPQRRKVREVQRVVAPPPGDEVHHHQHVGRDLARHDALALHLLGQPMVLTAELAKLLSLGACRAADRRRAPPGGPSAQSTARSARTRVQGPAAFVPIGPTPPSAAGTPAGRAL